MYYVIGIDGGGTKTEAVALDPAGNLLERYMIGATNPHAVTFEVGQQNLADIIGCLLSRDRLAQLSCRAICLGIAGIANEQEKFKYESFVRRYLDQQGIDAPVRLTNDAEIALTAAFENSCGMLAISGTGSIVYGLTPEGQQYRVGGWGHLLGDEGSGYEIGLQTLKAAMRSFDGVITKTMISDLIIHKYKLTHIKQLKEFIYQPSIKKRDIAEFAALCIHAAQQGDRVAEGIIVRAAASLAELALTLRSKNEWFAGSPIAAAGSVFNRSRMFMETFQREVNKTSSRIEVILSDAAPVFGAAKLALQLVKERGKHG